MIPRAEGRSRVLPVQEWMVLRRRDHAFMSVASQDVAAAHSEVGLTF